MEYTNKTNTALSDNNPIFLFSWLVMVINADSHGFLIGERRFKEMSEGVNQTENNTKQILKVMTDSFQDMQKELSKSSDIRNILARQNRSGKAQDASGLPDTAHSTRIAVDATEKAVEATEQALAASKRIRKKAIDAEVGLESAPSRLSGVSSTSKRAARARDSRGRFIGAGGEFEKKRIKSIFGLSGVSAGGADVGGIDPTVDAIRELNEAVTPVKNVFKGMSAKAIGIFSGRMKKRRGDEALPEDQIKSNKEVAKSDKKQNKLLQLILFAIRRQKGGGLSGLLGRGGWLLALLKGGGKALLKKIPLLGALIGGGFLAKDWSKLSSGGKGKGIGQIVGTVVGGMLGSFLGPVGTVAGGTLGNILGGIFGEKIGTWTDSLKIINFGTIFKDFLKDKLGIGDDSGKKAFIPYANAGQSKVDRFKNWALDKLGLSDSSDAASAGDSGPSANGRFAPLLDLIAKGEARGGAFGTSGYDTVYGGAKVRPSKEISKMTVGEVKEYQQQLLKSGAASTAVGRYQFIHNDGAFGKMAQQAGIKDTDTFDSATQDKLAIHYAGGKKQLDEWIKTGNHKALTNKTAQQWASMKNTRGVGNYDGDGLNKARHGGLQAITTVSEQMRQNAAEQVQPIAPIAPVKPKQQLPAAKGKSQDAVLFPQGATRPAPVKVPAVTPDLIKIGSKNKTQAISAAPSDSGISQTVGDRGLAHVMSGGIGYHQNNA